MMFLPIEQPSSKTLAFAAAVGFKPIMRAHASKALMAVWENALDSYIKSSYEFLMSDTSGTPFSVAARAKAAFFFLFGIFCLSEGTIARKFNQFILPVQLNQMPPEGAERASDGTGETQRLQTAFLPLYFNAAS